MIAVYAMPDAVHAYGISIAAYAAPLLIGKGVRHGSLVCAFTMCFTARRMRE